jgi:PKD repeat protein
MKMKSIHLLAAITALLLITMCEKDSPKASFTHGSESYEAGDTIFFHNTSTNANAYEWDFGDGNTSTEKNPWHIFDSTGNYTVTLISENENGTDEVSQSVIIKNPTILSITVNQITTDIPIASCVVKIYDNQSDLENGINEVWTGLTNSNGSVTFSHARAIVYYIYALKIETGGAWLYSGAISQIILNEINIFTVHAQWISGKKHSRVNNRQVLLSINNKPDFQ